MSDDHAAQAEIIERMVTRRWPRFMIDAALEGLPDVRGRVEARLSRVRSELEQKTLAELQEQELKEETETAALVAELDAMQEAGILPSLDDHQ